MQASENASFYGVFMRIKPPGITEREWFGLLKFKTDNARDVAIVAYKKDQWPKRKRINAFVDSLGLGETRARQLRDWLQFGRSWPFDDIPTAFYKALETCKDQDESYEEFATRAHVRVPDLLRWWFGMIPENFEIKRTADALQLEPIEKHALMVAAQEIEYVDAKEQTLEDDFVQIPWIEARLAAGSGEIATHEGKMMDLAFRRDWLSSVAGTETGRLFVFEIRGESMYPDIRDGDICLVDTYQQEFRQGWIYAVRCEGLLFAKRLQWYRNANDPEDPGKFWLVPENRHCPTIECYEEDLKIIGRIIWTAHSWTKSK